MADITIQNLRVAPSLGPRVPTTLRAYPRSSFLLNDADHTAVTESSPHNGGPYFKSMPLTVESTLYYGAADFTLPSTTDSPDNPNGARWGLAVFDDADSPRFMYWAGGLESFWLDHTDATQDAEDIRAYNLGGLPADTPSDRTVSGNLIVGGDTDIGGNLSVAGSTNIDGALDVGGVISGDMSGGTNFPVSATGPTGLDSDGSITIRADDDDDTPGALIDSGFGSVGAWTLVQRLSRTLVTFYQSVVGVFLDKGGQVFNVKAYGATGDGATDDTTAVLAALTAALAVRGRLYFPAGVYLLSGAGDELLLVNKSIEVFGDGMGASVLLVASSVGSSTDVICVKPPATGSPGPNDLNLTGRDNRGYYLHDFSILAQSGTPARNALRIDITAAGSWLHASTFTRLALGVLGGSPSIYMNNDAGGSPANTDGLYALTFSECHIRDGVLGDFVGDSVRFLGNKFREFNSSNRALDVHFVTGAGNFAFCFNNVYNKYGIRFRSGTKPAINFNFIEGPEVDFIGSNGAMLDLDGSTARIRGAEVRGNVLGVQTASLGASAVRVHACDDTLLDHNYYTVVNGNYGIDDTASAVRTTTRSAITELTGTGVLFKNSPPVSTDSNYTPIVYFKAPPAVLPGYFSIEQLGCQRFHTAVVTHTADVTLTTTDAQSTIIMNSAGARTAKLPPHDTGQSAGRILRFRNIGSANLTVQKADGTAATIDGAGTLVIAAGGKATVQASDVAEVWLTV